MKKSFKGLLKVLFLGALVCGYGCKTTSKKPQKVDVFRKYAIPKIYENYDKRGKIICEGEIKVKGMNCYIKIYDIDKDGERDVGELYLDKPKNSSQKPLFYGFEKNEEYGFNIFLDDNHYLNGNGLNGDEKIFPKEEVPFEKGILEKLCK